MSTNAGVPLPSEWWKVKSDDGVCIWPIGLKPIAAARSKARILEKILIFNDTNFTHVLREKNAKSVSQDEKKFIIKRIRNSR